MVTKSSVEIAKKFVNSFVAKQLQPIEALSFYTSEDSRIEFWKGYHVSLDDEKRTMTTGY